MTENEKVMLTALEEVQAEYDNYSGEMMEVDGESEVYFNLPESVTEAIKKARGES